MDKASSERGQDHTVDLNDCAKEAQIRPRRDSRHSLEVDGSLGSCDAFVASVISFVAHRTDCSPPSVIIIIIMIIIITTIIIVLAQGR